MGGVFLCRRVHQLEKVMVLPHWKWKTCGTQILWFWRESLFCNRGHLKKKEKEKKKMLLPYLCSLHLHG